MTRAEPPPLLVRLQSPGSLEDHVSALRSLKHELIGHGQRKEAWVSWGIIPILSKTLGLSKSGGKRPEERDGDQQRTHEEEAVLQAVIILGSLALGKKRDFDSFRSEGRDSSVQVARPSCRRFSPAMFYLPCSPSWLLPTARNG